MLSSGAGKLIGAPCRQGVTVRAMAHTYRVGIDIGGTFTDLVMERDDGQLATRKVPSTPDDYSRGIVDGLLAWLAGAGAGPGAVTGIVHATTVATNAILERRWARTGLLTTEGFRDVLEMRRLRIPVLYDLQYEKPPPLVDRRLRLEVTERMAPDGTVRVPLDRDGVAAAAGAFRDAGVEAVAVSFLHAYANPAHEIDACAILAAGLGPGVYLCRGSEILPEIREYERTSTAVVNAAIGPVVARYAAALVARLEAAGIGCGVEMMHSGGGLMRLASAVRRAAALVESGPAAGVIACARAAAGWHEANVISFDMGGTTAKAALVEHGRPARTSEYEVGAGINLSSRLVKGGGYPIKLPFIDVSEIGAGGGSLVTLGRGGVIEVGPRSAGAYPGPVCYGLGGTQATLSDAFVTLGYINDVALGGGALPIDAAAGRAALQDQVAGPLGMDLHHVARGVLTLAVSTMTRAVKAVTTYRGRDPREAALVAFGGNGAVVAAEVADALGIGRVLVPRGAGVFSALGLLRSEVEQEFVHPVQRLVADLDDAALAAMVAGLESGARAAMLAEGYALADAVVSVAGDLRYLGQAYELTVPCTGSAAALAEAFEAEHDRTYGHRSARDPVQLMSLRLTVRLPRAPLPGRFAPDRTLVRHDRMLRFDDWCGTAPVIGREALDDRLRLGPFVIEEADGTCIVPPGWTARRGADDAVLLERRYL